MNILESCPMSFFIANILFAAYILLKLHRIKKYERFLTEQINFYGERVVKNAAIAVKLLCDPCRDTLIEYQKKSFHQLNEDFEKIISSRVDEFSSNTDIL